MVQVVQTWCNVFGSYEGKFEGNILSIKTSKYQNCAQTIEHKIVMVPEDRKKHGIVSMMGVGKNITLSSLKSYCFGKMVVNEAKEEQIMAQAIKRQR